MFKRFLLLALIATLYACGQDKPLGKGLKLKSTSYDKYVKSLQMSDFDQTVLGQRWILAGEKVFNDNAVVDLPYHESGRFFADKPAATGIKFKAEKGELVNIKVKLIDTDDFLLFTDVFYLKDDSGIKNIYNSDIDKETEFKVEESGVYLLRLQPELMKGAKYAVAVTRSTDMEIAVAGKAGKPLLDNLPPIIDLQNILTEVSVDESAFGKFYRVNSPLTNLKAAPNSKSDVVGQISQNNPIEIVGGTNSWYKVKLISGIDGYIHKSNIEALDEPIKVLAIKEKQPVFKELYDIGSPVDTLNENTQVKVLAEIDSYLLIQKDSMEQAWIKIEQNEPAGSQDKNS